MRLTLGCAQPSVKQESEYRLRKIRVFDACIAARSSRNAGIGVPRLVIPALPEQLATRNLTWEVEAAMDSRDWNVLRGLENCGTPQTPALLAVPYWIASSQGISRQWTRRVGCRESIPQRADWIDLGCAPGGQETRCQGGNSHHHECGPEGQRVAWTHLVQEVSKQSR